MGREARARASRAAVKAGNEAKRAGMRRAEAGAGDEWIARAVKVIKAVCKRRKYFTADHVWNSGLERPQEGRAFGPAMMRAVAAGYCEKTTVHWKTSQPKSHRAPIQVWKSRLFRGEFEFAGWELALAGR